MATMRLSRTSSVQNGEPNPPLPGQRWSYVLEESMKWVSRPLLAKAPHDHNVAGSTSAIYVSIRRRPRAAAPRAVGWVHRQFSGGRIPESVFDRPIGAASA